MEFVIFFNIGFEDIDTTKMEELHNAFVKKLSRYSHDKLKGSGLALMLRGDVDFLIRKWGTREGCKESGNLGIFDNNILPVQYVDIVGRRLNR